MKLYQYVARGLVAMIPKLLLVSGVVFLLIQLPPGSPVDLLAPPRAGPEVIAELTQKYGLDEPLYVQYLTWLTNVLQGDFGTSIKTGKPVLEMILARLPITLRFTTLGLVLMYLIAIPVGVVSALRQNTWIDYVSMGFVLLGVSFPAFWIGILFLIIFGIQLEWVAIAGYGTLGLLLMPAIALALRGSAVEARVIRSSMVETMQETYIQVARANGLSNRSVVLKHALRNAILPVVTLLGLRLGWVIASGVVLEIVFSRPGVGRLMVNSIFGRDYPVVQGILLILAAAIMFGNLLADVLYSVADPRIRYD
ncbi:ABC transporter permease [Halorubrum halophilum]|jgi:ABC-type dipeptide/oligopeptide/nickel transport system permease component|uniref:ABC transporter permease n=1 Tax=Halorubrum halophilum TaxID=413816 RepID=UPI00186AFAE7|nr:ABC transporter permease [Halorubrum halophilum]